MEIQRIDLTEIVFRRRNKKYGAYHLRRVYVTHTRNALFIALFCCGLLLAAPFGVQAFRNMLDAEAYAAETAPEPEEATAVLETPPLMEEEQPLPAAPELPSAPPPPRATVEFTVPDPVDDEQAPSETDIKAQEELRNMEQDIGFETNEGEVSGGPSLDDIGLPGGAGKLNTEVLPPDNSGDEAPDPTIYQNVEKEPVAVNLNQIRRELVYPLLLRNASVEGKVILRVLINKEGRYMRHIVLRSPHKLMTVEAEKHLQKLRFTPAIQNNKPIKFWVNVPIDFRIDQ